jgi:hypothetical protein
MEVTGRDFASGNLSLNKETSTPILALLGTQ